VAGAALGAGAEIEAMLFTVLLLSGFGTEPGSWFSGVLGGVPEAQEPGSYFWQKPSGVGPIRLIQKRPYKKKAFLIRAVFSPNAKL